MTAKTDFQRLMDNMSVEDIKGQIDNMPVVQKPEPSKKMIHRLAPGMSNFGHSPKKRRKNS